MSDRLQRLTLIFAALFFLTSMGIMLVYARDKVIVVADVAQDQIGSGAVPETENVYALDLESAKDADRQICIPLKSGQKAESIFIENRYMTRELWVSIDGCEADFYGEKAVRGDMAEVEAGTYEKTQTGVLLKFKLQDVYECKNVLKDDELYIELVKPREIYEKIVVIDAACGGTDSGAGQGEWTEKAVALDVAKRLKEKLDVLDMKVYYTRTEDMNVTAADRIALANAVKADMFISIGAAAEPDDKTKYGTEAVYSDTFFIPDFDSARLADVVEQEVVMQISGRGNGLIAADEDTEVVQKAMVPATIIRLGYLSNPQEAALLAREDYRQRAAEGIYNAILKVYEGEE